VYCSQHSELALKRELISLERSGKQVEMLLQAAIDQRVSVHDLLASLDSDTSDEDADE
jgi:hypothetical protein